MNVKESTLLITLIKAILTADIYIFARWGGHVFFGQWRPGSRENKTQEYMKLHF